MLIFHNIAQKTAASLVPFLHQRSYHDNCVRLRKSLAVQTVDFNTCSIPTIPLCILFQHHCRKCGAVVCGPCSSQRWLLAEQASKPLRVCLNCYEKLKQGSGGGGEVVGKLWLETCFYFIFVSMDKEHC